MWIRLTPLLLALALLDAAQGPRIYIVTDMEGVGGVNSWDEQVAPGQRRYDETRKLLAGEVNAAAEGAFEAGASEVVIWDGHDSSRSLSVADIHQRAKLVQGAHTPPDYYLSEKLYDGIMIIGQHAMAGTKDGLLAHSQSRGVKGIFINEREVGEIGQTAAIGGYFGIPVIMLSGDEAACREMLGLQPKAETVAVKRLVGKDSALSLSHEEARRQIREHARQAVLRIREFAPWRIEGPVEMRFEFLPGADGKQAPPRVFRGRTVLEAYQQWISR